MRDSLFLFYTTARKARFSAYAGFALIACCYIAVNSLSFHRAEREISYEVTCLLAALVGTAPLAYHFIHQKKEKRPGVDRHEVQFEKLKYEVMQRPLELVNWVWWAQRHQPPLKLLLAEDQETTRLLRTMLNERKMEVVAEASSGMEVLEKAHFLKPDLVLLDLRMPDRISGFEVARQITRSLPNTKVLILGMDVPSSAIEHETIDAGAIGYLHKAHLDQFDGILETIQGDKITRRHEEIVSLIANGESIEDIALKLSISEDAVENDCLKIIRELSLFRAGQRIAPRRLA